MKLQSPLLLRRILLVQVNSYIINHVNSYISDFVTHNASDEISSLAESFGVLSYREIHAFDLDHESRLREAREKRKLAQVYK